MLFAISFIGILVLTALLGHFKWDIFRHRVNPWLIENATLLGAYRSMLAFVGFPIVILGGLYTYQQLSQRLARPELALAFADPKEATVSIWNVSSTVVRDPKYDVVLFNVDDPTSSFDPLPIPVARGDYIRLGERWGPNQMIGQERVKARVKDGDRLIGWASVMCPECPRRFYWVYIKHGSDGWYAELAEGEFPDVPKSAKLAKEPETFFAAFMSTVAEGRRIRLAGSGYSEEVVPEVLRK